LTTADGTSRSWVAPLDRRGGRPHRGARLRSGAEAAASAARARRR
jgi:hypothetical protein